MDHCDFIDETISRLNDCLNDKKINQLIYLDRQRIFSSPAPEMWTFSSFLSVYYDSNRIFLDFRHFIHNNYSTSQEINLQYN